MFGTNTASIERKAFRSDLNRFLDAEAAEVRRGELIEQCAVDSVQPGQEFYPWTFEHFEEAIGNAPNGDLVCMYATVAAAVDLSLDNHLANHAALSAVKQLVEKYWLECARHDAEKN